MRVQRARRQPPYQGPVGGRRGLYMYKPMFLEKLQPSGEGRQRAMFWWKFRLQSFPTNATMAISILITRMAETRKWLIDIP